MSNPGIYIVFDGPPSHGHGLGKAQTGSEWRKREDGYWTLGPFAPIDGGVSTDA